MGSCNDEREMRMLTKALYGFWVRNVAILHAVVKRLSFNELVGHFLKAVMMLLSVIFVRRLGMEKQ